MGSILKRDGWGKNGEIAIKSLAFRLPISEFRLFQKAALTHSAKSRNLATS